MHLLCKSALNQTVILVCHQREHISIMKRKLNYCCEYRFCLCIILLSDFTERTLCIKMCFNFQVLRNLEYIRSVVNEKPNWGIIKTKKYTKKDLNILKCDLSLLTIFVYTYAWIVIFLKSFVIFSLFSYFCIRNTHKKREGLY